MSSTKHGRTLLLAVGLACLSPPPASAGLIDDFSDGDDSGWTHHDYTEGESYGPAVFDATSGVYRIASQGGHVRPDNEGLISFWHESADDEYFNNGYVRARVRATDSNTVVGLGMRGGEDKQGDPIGYLYGVSASSGSMIIGRYNGPSLEFLTPFPPPFTGFGPGHDWIFEASAVDERLEFKVWRADRKKPRSPQLRVSDSTYAAGQVGVVSIQSAHSPNRAFGAIFDDVQFTSRTPGDYNGDGVLTASDIDALNVAINTGEKHTRFDLNYDGNVEPADHRVWIKDAKHTWVGDANLDGEFSSEDMVAVFQAGAYERDVDVGWSEGDWTGDRRFGSEDLVAAFQDGGYELGPRVALSAVPEPSYAILLGIGILSLCRFRQPR